MQTNTIAIVADDPSVRQTLCAPLSNAGYAVLEYDSRMIDSLSSGVDAVCLSVKDAAGLELIERVRSLDPDLPVLLAGPSELAAQAVEAGAYDFVQPSVDAALFCRVVTHAVEKHQLTLKLQSLRSELESRQDGGGGGGDGSGDVGAGAGESEEVVPLRELERQAIGRALRATKGSVTKAAKLLGIGRATLYRRLASPDMAGLRPRRGFETAPARPPAVNHTTMTAAGEHR